MPAVRLLQAWDSDLGWRQLCERCSHSLWHADALQMGSCVPPVLQICCRQKKRVGEQHVTSVYPHGRLIECPIEDHIVCACPGGSCAAPLSRSGGLAWSGMLSSASPTSLLSREGLDTLRLGTAGAAAVLLPTSGTPTDGRLQPPVHTQVPMHTLLRQHGC